jgi:Rrf2 family transcriptional regulator, cysteine metabolism repressor
MKLTAKGEYGVRAMVRLALHYRAGPVPLPEIARQEDISLQFLEQIFLTLRRAGLIESVRGARGGYALAKPPGEIPIGDIIEALEGPIAPVECLVEPEGEGHRACRRQQGCLTRGIWEKLRDRMQEVLEDISLEDMITLEQEKES